MKFKRLSDLDLRGKRVFIRADLNVPQDDLLAITDDTRIRASLPAIRHAMQAGAARLRGRPHSMLLTRVVFDFAAAWTRLGVRVTRGRRPRRRRRGWLACAAGGGGNFD